MLVDPCLFIAPEWSPWKVLGVGVPISHNNNNALSSFVSLLQETHTFHSLSLQISPWCLLLSQQMGGLSDNCAGRKEEEEKEESELPRKSFNCYDIVVQYSHVGKFLLTVKHHVADRGGDICQLCLQSRSSTVQQ